MKRTPLFEQLKTYLRQLINENIDKEDYKLPSEMELSNMFDISRITSKKALNDLEDEGLIIRIHGKGSFISENAKTILPSFINEKNTSKNLFMNKKIISIIVPDITSQFYIDILNSILRYTIDKEVTIQIQNANVQLENELSIIKKLAYSSNGLIIFPLDNINYAKEIIRLSMSKLSIVCIDNFLKNTNIPCIASDNYEATYNATKSLISDGTKKIKYISLDKTNEFSLEERYKGYISALKDSNIDINFDLISVNLTHNDIFVDFILDNILSSDDYDAIISANCGLGIEIAKTLIKLNKKELINNLIIFDDEFGKLKEILKFNPRCIRQNAELIGTTAIDVIMESFEKKNSLIQKKIIKIPTEIRY